MLVARRLHVMMTVVVVLALAGPAAAQGTGAVTIRGFGGIVVGGSDEYPYLAGSGEGEPEWENGEFSLNITSLPVENLRIQAQLGIEVENDGSETELEMAFAEWTFSDKFHFRGGISRLPFGNYASILDVGTLRPFYFLPQSVYGSIGVITESYIGFGAWGQMGNDWHITYDVYVGGLKADERESWRVLDDDIELDADEEWSEDLENVLGAHVVFGTPLEGLSFGLSAYSGKPEAEQESPDEGGAPSWGDHKTFGIQLEYLNDAVLLRTEYVKALKDEDIDSYYVELAYRLSKQWQLATSYEAAEVDIDQELDYAKSLLEHSSWAVGVNYWFSPQMVLKLSYHGITGNLLAHPSFDELDEILEAGENPEESNRLIALGLQLSF